MKTQKIVFAILAFFSVSVILWALAINSMQENFFAGGFAYGGIASSEEKAYEQALVESLEYYFAESYNDDALFFEAL
jgi:ribosomal protein S12 methylthiotransferase accessory factor YcaO